MIINYFTDNDLYKFTTMNAIRKEFPEAEVIYRFVNRGKTVFPEGFADALKKEIQAMRHLALTKEEEVYMTKKCYFFDPVFFDLLKGFRFNPDEVSIHQTGGDLQVEIRGFWYRTVLWEVPIMAIISELYFQMTRQKAQCMEEKTIAKAKQFAEIGAEISEFGTRRRFSFDVQDRVIQILKQHTGKFFNGTSNVYFGMKHNLTPIGTHPHEWFMYHGAHYGYRVANTQGLANWVKVYEGNLGIALTDTYTTDNFFQSFNTQFTKLFDGLRWDSGDPYAFTEKALQHYMTNRIDPKTKTIVYSDSLDFECIQKIKEYVNGRIHDVYGVGTYLTNDVGVRPLNIVIKISECKPKGCDHFLPTVKLSDSNGKHTGQTDEIDLCLKTLRIKN